jgi:ferrochelatase
MYEALVIVSFGGPERPEDVLPFLENVTRGRNVPRDRLLEVADHYTHFGGKSPINDQNRALIRALREEFQTRSIDLPIYWGNRNWHPFLSEAIRQMSEDGVRGALAFMTSAYSSYSGCRQYRENIAAAQAEVGQNAPEIHKVRAFYNHPGFIAANADRVLQALAKFDPADREDVYLVATAHSVPSSMAASSDYEKQLHETARLVAAASGVERWSLAYQSRSGPPSQPWLGPDILEHLRLLQGGGVRNVVVAPIGFVSDHLEVLYDLDTEAAGLARELGIKLVRAGTAGTHVAFIDMVCQLVEERITPGLPKRAIGLYGPSHDVCPTGCCPAPVYRPVASAAPSVSRPA